MLVGAGGARLDDFDWDFLPGEDVDADGGEGLAYQAAIGTRLFFRDNGTVAARLEVSSLWEDTLDDTHRHTSYTAGRARRFRRIAPPIRAAAPNPTISGTGSATGGGRVTTPVSSASAGCRT